MMNQNFELHEFKYLSGEYKGNFFENQRDYIFRIKTSPEEVSTSSLLHHDKYEPIFNQINKAYFASVVKEDAHITFLIAGVVHIIKLPIEVLSIEDKNRKFTIKLKPKINNVTFEKMIGFKICIINIDFTDFLGQLEKFNCINVS
ncbi:mg166 protein [Tupanvirus deep ocean]|uniref:Mg166 protein n=2 Tax=Tupanvirus TaxID=2094720 RepID=A0AC62A7A9_9VIRU|nr:mg166 protein [Tupanvirus deep ocean]QKU33604.1 mg166 protein [Tupanvirus deep ocean]